MNLKEELTLRGFLHQYTHEEIFSLYEKGWQSLYWWVDPSSDSMQLGNLISLMFALNIAKKGNKLYLIVWWATGMIWNPSWKDAERNFLSEEQIEYNQKNIEKQIKFITWNIKNIAGYNIEVEVINNYQFFKNMDVVQFLREVWKYITVNWMMNKDIVRKRIEDPDKFISYAEFSYMLLMWYDFYRLYKDKWVKLEVGGSDEWDWIITWIELIWKKLWETAYGMTNKLILDSSWKKFGKSEWNAVWLDKKKNSPYFVYQYLLNLADEDVNRFLKLLTFLPLDEIKQITEKHFQKPENRYWQRKLAEYVIKMIFWDKELEIAQKISSVMFSKWEDKLKLIENLNTEEIESLAQEVGSIQFKDGDTNIDLFVKWWLTSSKQEAKKLMKQEALYLNEQKITAIRQLNEQDFLKNNIAIIRKGKKSYRVVMR